MNPTEEIIHNYTQYHRALSIVQTLRGLSGNKFARRQMRSALADLERCRAKITLDESTADDQEPK